MFDINVEKDLLLDTNLIWSIIPIASFRSHKYIYEIYIEEEALYGKKKKSVRHNSSLIV